MCNQPHDGFQVCRKEILGLFLLVANGWMQKISNLDSSFQPTLYWVGGQGKHALHQTHANNQTLLDLHGFLLVWGNGKSYGSAKISFILPLSASKAKEQHKKKHKACENHIMYFL